MQEGIRFARKGLKRRSSFKSSRNLEYPKIENYSFNQFFNSLNPFGYRVHFHGVLFSRLGSFPRTAEVPAPDTGPSTNFICFLISGRGKFCSFWQYYFFDLHAVQVASPSASPGPTHV